MCHDAFVGMIPDSWRPQLLLVAMIFVAVAVGLVVYSRRGESRAKAARFTERDLRCLIEDHRLLREAGIFSPGARTADAGRVLNPLIGVDGSPPVAGDLVPDWVGEAPSTRAQRETWLSDPDTAPDGDFSFLGQLSGFDHLDTRSSGAFGRAWSESADPFLPSAGAPDITVVADASRLRLAQGLRRGDLLDALGEVRHLARMIASDETIGTLGFAQVVLDTEREAYDAGVRSGVITPDQWTPVSAETTGRMRRAMVGTVDLLLGRGPSDAWSELQAAGGVAYGECAYLGAGLTGRRTRQVLLADRRSFEPTWQWMDAPVRAALSDTGCEIAQDPRSLAPPRVSRDELLLAVLGEDVGQLRLLMGLGWLRAWTVPLAFQRLTTPPHRRFCPTPGRR